MVFSDRHWRMFIVLKNGLLNSETNVSMRVNKNPLREDLHRTRQCWRFDGRCSFVVETDFDGFPEQKPMRFYYARDETYFFERVIMTNEKMRRRPDRHSCYETSVKLDEMNSRRRSKVSTLNSKRRRLFWFKPVCEERTPRRTLDKIRNDWSRVNLYPFTDRDGLAFE